MNPIFKAIAGKRNDVYPGFTRLSELMAYLTPRSPMLIGVGSKLLVDIQMQDSDALGKITNFGTIAFDKRVATRLLCDAVDNTGSFLAGTATVPHPTTAILDLCGARPLVNGFSPAQRTALGIGSNLITGLTHNVNTSTGNNGKENDNYGISRALLNNPGGSMKMYGQAGVPRRRLNAHYVSGTTLVLDAPITAKAGDTILIGPSGFFDTAKRTEVRTLAADVNNSVTVTINAALGYARWGLMQYLTDTGISLTQSAFTLKTVGNPGGMRTHVDQTPEIDQRAFVAIINRNVKVRGYDANGNTDLATYGYGMHQMSMGLTAETVIDNVQFENYGQLGLLGRYGVHIHIASYDVATGNKTTDGYLGTNKYEPGKAVFNSCTFFKGQNRAVDLHGCLGVIVTNNISHNSAGHAFFLEDGSEEENTLQNNTAFCPRDPGSQRLKSHDGPSPFTGLPGVSGFWFANQNNTFVDNLATDCPGHFWWNSVTPGKLGSEGALVNAYNASPSTTGGCLGATNLAKIYPWFGKQGLWSGNGGLTCGATGGISDDYPIDDQGNTATGSPKTTTNGLPGAPYGNPFEVASVFKNWTHYKCNNGGYQNRIKNPNYVNAKSVDCFNSHFAGAVADGFMSGTIVKESLNSEGGALTGVVNGFASYHGLLAFKDLSAYGFSGGVATPKNFNTLLKSAVIQSWDMYTAPVFGLSIDDSNWAMYNSLGIYQTAPPCLMNDSTIWNASYGGLQFYEDNAGAPGTPPPSTTGLHFRWSLGCNYDKWGFFSTGPASVGAPQSYIVCNHPFFTTGLASSTPMPEHNGTSVYTPTPFFGINMQSDDTYATIPFKNFYAACSYQRVDTNMANIAGAVFSMRDSYEQTGAQAGPTEGSFFNNMKHTHVPRDAIVKFIRAGTSPNATRFTSQISRISQIDNPASGVDDSFILGIPWSGTVAPTTVSLGGQAYTTAADWATLQAATTGYRYLRDTTANMVWVRVRFNVGQQPAGTNHFNESYQLLSVLA